MKNEGIINILRRGMIYNKDKDRNLFARSHYTKYFLLLVTGMTKDNQMDYSTKDIWQKHYKKWFYEQKIIEDTSTIKYQRGKGEVTRIEEYKLNQDAILKRFDDIVRQDIDNVIKNTKNLAIGGRLVLAGFPYFGRLIEELRDVFIKSFTVYCWYLLKNKKDLDTMDNEMRNFLIGFDWQYITALYPQQEWGKYQPMLRTLESLIKSNYIKHLTYHPVYTNPIEEVGQTNKRN